MNCPHRGHGRGICDGCRKKHAERRGRLALAREKQARARGRIEALAAESRQAAAAGIMAELARCTHDGAHVVLGTGIEWCPHCGAFCRVPAAGHLRAWAVPWCVRQAMTLDGAEPSVGTSGPGPADDSDAKKRN